MSTRLLRPLLVLLATLLLTAPTVAHAHDHAQDRQDRGHGGSPHWSRSPHADLPSAYVLAAAGAADPAIYPEGIAVDHRLVYVGSTTDGTIYRGDLADPVLTPFLGPDDAEGRTSAIGLEVDRRTLFVAGGATGRVFAYDVRTGELVGAWQVTDPAGSPTFLNDIATTPRGDVYVTDSQRAVLYRIDRRDRRTEGVEALPTFLSFDGTALEYLPGFNLNGIVSSRNGKYLVVAQSNTGRLFRIGVRDGGSVVPIDLGGAAVSGDGLVLDRSTLYAVERQGDTGYVVEIELDRSLTSGDVVGRATHPSFDDPTTAALVRGSLLVVNSQFGERTAGVEPGPFTVSRVPAP